MNLNTWPPTGSGGKKAPPSIIVCVPDVRKFTPRVYVWVASSSLCRVNINSFFPLLLPPWHPWGTASELHHINCKLYCQHHAPRLTPSSPSTLLSPVSCNYLYLIVLRLRPMENEFAIDENNIWSINVHDWMWCINIVCNFHSRHNILDSFFPCFFLLIFYFPSNVLDPIFFYWHNTQTLCIYDWRWASFTYSYMNEKEKSNSVLVRTFLTGIVQTSLCF